MSDSWNLPPGTTPAMVDEQFESAPPRWSRYDAPQVRECEVEDCGDTALCHLETRSMRWFCQDCGDDLEGDLKK